MNGRDLILGVLSALDWGGPVRVGSVSVHVYNVPRGGTWRDGTVHVETVPTGGWGPGEPCGWPIMTEAEALMEANGVDRVVQVQVGRPRGQFPAYCCRP